MVARQSPRSGEGLVVAAKGGHNQEHHNHNDVGQFILLADGVPMIIDVGVGEYTRETFGPNRYRLWYIRGAGHNAPVVGGVEQAAGRAFAARDAAFEASPDAAALSMELAGAYPPEAKLRSLRRTIQLTRGGDPAVQVTDAYETDAGAVQVHLFTPGEAVVEAGGQVRLSNGGRSVILRCEAAEVDVQPWPVDDARLAGAWGRTITRLTVTARPQGPAGRYTLTFRKADCGD